MINERTELDERIKQQDDVIRHLDNRMDRYVRNNDKIRGLLSEYDRGEMEAKLLVSHLRMYV